MKSPRLFRPALMSVLIVLPILLSVIEQASKNRAAPATNPASTASPAAPATVPSAAPHAIQTTPSPEASTTPEPSTAPSVSPAAAPPAQPSATPGAGPASPKGGQPAQTPSAAPASSASPGPAGGGEGENTEQSGIFEGTVLDAQSDLPVNRAEVMIPEINAQTFTNEKGYFKIHAVPGRSQPYEVMVQHPGHESLYETVTVSTGQGRKVTFKIKRKGF